MFADPERKQKPALTKPIILGPLHRERIYPGTQYLQRSKTFKDHKRGSSVRLVDKASLSGSVPVQVGMGRFVKRNRYKKWTLYFTIYG